MVSKTTDVKIDDGSFFTPGKGINQMMISLFIWFITGIICKIATLFSNSVKYELVCFVSSFLLSIIAGIIINEKLLKNQDFVKKIVFGFANIVLLYTSSNGIQAAYCVIPQPKANELKSASLIPFIEARPWLPDLFHVTIINNLKSDVAKLRIELTDAKSTQTGDQLKLLNEMNSIRNENTKLKQQVDSCSKYTVSQPQVDNSHLFTQIDTLLQRIQAFNNRQSLWQKTSIRYVNSAREIVQSGTHDVTFYDFLFNTPLDASLFITKP